MRALETALVRAMKSKHLGEQRRRSRKWTEENVQCALVSDDYLYIIVMTRRITLAYKQQPAECVCVPHEKRPVSFFALPIMLPSLGEAPEAVSATATVVSSTRIRF